MKIGLTIENGTGSVSNWNIWKLTSSEAQGKVEGNSGVAITLKNASAFRASQCRRIRKGN